MGTALPRYIDGGYMNNKKFENDLTEGSVAKQLLIFAAPFILSNLIQSLYSVADMIIVGNFAGINSMSGVFNGSQLTMLITNAVIGLTVGATVLIGQYLGAGKKHEIFNTISTLFTVLIIIGAALMVLTPFCQDAMLRLMRVPSEAYSEARIYFFICMMGTLFVFAYNALAAVMRGMGDSKHPLVFVAVAAVSNIILDIVLVKFFSLGASGAAYATVFSQALSVVLCIIYMRKNNFTFDFKPSSFKINKITLSLLFKIGFPTMVNNIATSASFIFLAALANDISVEASAAVGAVGKFNGFAILPAIAISSAISAMVAQNFGSNKMDRVKKTAIYGSAMAIGITLIIFILVRIFPEPVLRVFCDDDEMARLGCEYLASFSFDYIIVPFQFCLNGLFIGTGHTLVSLVSGITGALLFRIPTCYLFGVVLDMGLAGIGLGAPIASAVSLIISVIFLLSGKWKKQVIR